MLRKVDRLRFLLINPASPTWRVHRGEKPRGSRFFRFSMLSGLYVAASMPPYVETRILDEEVEPIDFEADVDLVGISFMTYNAPRAYQIADKFRSDRKKPVFLGGYHPTFLPDEAIQHSDAVCIGEAEASIPRMMADYAAGSLKPFYCGEPGDLAGLPRLDRSLLRREYYAPVEVIQATRGCHYRCSFCSVAAFHNHRFRVRPVADVVDELKGLGKYVLFMDDHLTADPNYAKQLFAEMIPLRKQWFSQVGVGLADDEELLGLAVRSGCRGVFIGFESLSPDALRSWRKRPNLGRDYLEAVRKLHESGIAVCAAFVFGADYDTPEVFSRTLDFLLEANVETLQATRLTPFPGTELYADLDRQNRILDKDWSHYDFNNVVFEPRNMDPQTLSGGVSWVLREFHSRKRVASRVWNSLRYLDPVLVFAGVLPLNLGWRCKLTADGNFARAAGFVRRA